jgi:hypothetical protein
MTANSTDDLTTRILVQLRDEMRSAFNARFDALEGRIERLETRNEKERRELFSRIDTLDSDLKKFSPVVNEAIPHLADEMDKVRDRPDNIETELGIVYPSE